MDTSAVYLYSPNPKTFKGNTPSNISTNHNHFLTTAIARLHLGFIAKKKSANIMCSKSLEIWKPGHSLQPSVWPSKITMSMLNFPERGRERGEGGFVLALSEIGKICYALIETLHSTHIYMRACGKTCSLPQGDASLVIMLSLISTQNKKGSQSHAFSRAWAKMWMSQTFLEETRAVYGEIPVRTTLEKIREETDGTEERDATDLRA